MSAGWPCSRGRALVASAINLHYHFVFTTKYRKPVLIGEVGHAERDLIREICRGEDIEILQAHVRPDHVHLLVSAPPLQSTSVDPESLAFRRGSISIQCFLSSS